MRQLRSPFRRALTAAQVENFDRDGFLCPLDGVGVAEAEQARARIEAAESCSNQSGNALFTNGHLLHRWQYELATDARLLDAVEDVLGPHLLIWKCQLWIKEARSSSYIGWHQDAAYWGLDPPDSVNVWLALTDVTEEHGPMELYARSHAEPLLEHADEYVADNMLTRGQVIPQLQHGRPGPDPARVVPALLRPGQFSLHHLCTAHGGKRNRAAGRRIGFNVTFVAPHVRSVRAAGASAMPVRGCGGTAGAGGVQWCDEFAARELAHWTLDPVPPPLCAGASAGPDPEPSAAAVAAHRAKNEGLAHSIMEGADLGRFSAVSEKRVGKNLPDHVSADDAAAVTTSLASAMLAQQQEQP
eukprot:g417.t1